MLMMMRRTMDRKNKDRQGIKIKIGLSRPYFIVKLFSAHIILPNDLTQGQKAPEQLKLYMDIVFLTILYLRP